MLKKIICCSFASLDGYNGSANQKESQKSLNIYLMNAAVSCYSAKINNPTVDVAFIHNLKKLPSEFEMFLKKNNIKNIYLEFNNFRFSSDYKWSLAFYKLNVIKYLSFESNYDEIILLDTDTFILGSLDSIWEICKSSLMLYNVQHSLELEVYKERLNEYYELYNKKIYPAVWGGEFVAGSRKILKKFIFECEKVYSKMILENFNTQFGDEFITFCAAENYDGRITDAAPYVRRYWTTNIYFQCFTDHELLLKILRVPNEKNNGFISIYKYICKHNKLPNKRNVFKMLGLPRCKSPLYVRNIINYRYRILRRFL